MAGRSKPGNWSSGGEFGGIAWMRLCDVSYTETTGCVKPYDSAMVVYASFRAKAVGAISYFSDGYVSGWTNRVQQRIYRH